MALKVGNVWYLDENHSLTVDNAEKLPGNNMVGYPIVGDFDGDGKDDLGLDGRRVLAESEQPGADRRDDRRAVQSRHELGVHRRARAADRGGLRRGRHRRHWVVGAEHSGGTPQTVGEWYILVSDGRSILNRIRVNPQDGGNIVDFVPVPFGADEFTAFGSDFALPVVGNFDPHHIQVPLGGVVYGLTNLDDPTTSTATAWSTAYDALILINEINQTARGACRWACWADRSWM